MYNTIGIDFVGFVCTHNSQKLYTNIKNIVIFLYIYQIWWWNQIIHMI
jgi:hypothetical protein